MLPGMAFRRRCQPCNFWGRCRRFDYEQENKNDQSTSYEVIQVGRNYGCVVMHLDTRPRVDTNVDILLI